MASFLRFHLFQMKYMLGIQDIRYRVKKSPHLLAKLFAVFIPLLILVAVILTPYVFILYLCFKMTQVMGSPESYISLVLFMAQILILFFSLLSSFTSMFGRKDHELLSSLPIPKRYIYMSAVLNVYGSGVLTAALVLIPSVIIYGIGQGFSPQMVVMMIPAILLIPVIPACVAYAIVLLLMRLLMFFPFKEQLATILGILLLVGYMIFNYSFSSKVGGWLNVINWSTIFDGSTGWFAWLTRLLPGIYLTRITLLGSVGPAALSFVLILLISCAFLALMYFVGGKSFFAIRAGMAMQANTRKAKVRYREHKPFMAYIKKEYKTILRSPIYVINGLLGVILGPVMLLCVVFQDDVDGLQFMSSTLVAETGNPKWMLLPILIISGILCFMISTVVMIPSTSYSREGLSRWVSQVAPISAKTDFMGRAFASLLLFWIGDMLTWCVGWYIFRFTILEGVLFLLAVLILAIPCVLFGLIIDYKRPKLKWEKEAQAMKQNTNAVIAMFLSWLFSILCLLPTVLYMFFDCINRVICLLLTLSVPILLAAVSVIISLKILNRRIVKL